MSTVNISDNTLAKKLLADLLSALNKRADGTIEYIPVFAFDDLFPVFNEIVKIESELTDRERAHIVRRSVIDMKRSDKREISDLVSFCREKLREEMKRPKKVYLLSTTISLRRFPTEAKFHKHLDGTQIKISHRYPRKIKVSEWFLNGFGEVNCATPASYACLYASTIARTEEQAASKMLQCIDTMISVMNLTINRRSRHVDSGKAWPRNAIRLGPYQVLYSASGKQLEEQAWYEPEFVEEMFPKSLAQLPRHFQPFVKYFLNKVYKHPLKTYILSALRQYNAALGSKDKHTTLSKLWSSLEILTNSTTQESKVTIRRASFFSSKIEFRRLKLEYAANCRNRFIHLGTENHEIENITEDLRMFLEEIICKIVFSRKTPYAPRQFFHMLDGPVFAADVHSAKHIMKLAENFRSA